MADDWRVNNILCFQGTFNFSNHAMDGNLMGCSQPLKKYSGCEIVPTSPMKKLRPRQVKGLKSLGSVSGELRLISIFSWCGDEEPEHIDGKGR